MRSESEVLAGVLGYLNLRGDVFAWRNNTGSFKDQAGRFVSFGYKGSADILGVWAPHGKLLAVECKREQGGVVSRDQKTFAERVTAAGGIYILARSIEDVEAVLGKPVTKLPPSRRFHRG